MQALDTLNDKLDLLIKKYQGLQAENKRLRDVIAGQNEELEATHKKLSVYEDGLVDRHLGNTLGDDEEKETMRKQLDAVIADIDKILTTLDD
jgi:cell division septum initiation protein DivIVA